MTPRGPKIEVYFGISADGREITRVEALPALALLKQALSDNEGDANKALEAARRALIQVARNA